MKLVKCYVSSFGNLQDFTYDFNDGLNTVKQDNGWGKTTLATFIKSMFYGLNDSKRNVSENERLRFKPWGVNEKFGGFVQFVWGDKEYKIERYFGSKESEDTIALYDVASGKLFKNTENLGKRIFEIDEEGFLSTTYFAQKDFQAKSNTSLTAKFNAVCEMQDTEAFDRAVHKLEEKAKTFKYRGDKGLIADAKREIYYVNEQIDRANRALNTVKILTEEEKQIKVEVDRLQQQTKILTQKVVEAGKAEALAVKKKRYDKLTQEKLSVEQDIKTAEQVLNGKNVSEAEVENKSEKLRSLRTLIERESSVEKDISLLGQTSKNQKNKSAGVGVNIALIVSVALFLLSSILFWSLKLSIVAIISVCVAIVLALALVFKVYLFDKKSNKNKTPYDDILRNKMQELELISQEKTMIEGKLSDFISQFNFGEKLDISTALNYLLKIVRVYGELKIKKAKILCEIEEIGYEENLQEKLGQIEELSLLNQQLSSVQAQYTNKANELSSKRSAMAMHEQLANSFTELESQKAEINQKIIQYEQEYDILTKTVKFLKQADENLKIKYRAPLQESLKKYYGYIDGAEKDLSIDVDLKVTVGERSGQKVTEYYSKGYQNLFEICKRFALTDVLFRGEKPFIILDDPFYNLDDKKIASAIELIKKLANDYQIIYMVCHDSRRA